MATQTKPTTAAEPIPVTPDNFIRAETDMYFAQFAKSGGFGKFNHARDLPLGENTGVRPNRDTLYSLAVFDLDAGPVTITLPDASKRFMTMMVVDQDHYVSMVTYGKGAHTLDRKTIGTRYVFAAVRTLVDPANPEDISQAHALQDAVKVSQQSVGKLETPHWDPASQKKVREALLILNETLPDLRRAGGRREEVDPVRHLIATASAWGLNPDKDAIYLNVTPASNDGKTVYRLTVKDVPVDGFWSVTVYDERVSYWRTAATPIASTTSRRRETQTGRSRSSSAAATARSRTAYRSCRGGTTWSVSIARARRFLTTRGSFPRRSR